MSTVATQAGAGASAEILASNSGIIQAYRAKTPGSAALAAEARELLPSGIVHDARHLEPYGIYVVRAEGSRKWDQDGNEYVDYAGGHGALLLGHGRPEVLAAIQEALPEGTHPGANHEREVRWAQIVRELVPCAERVRFTSSGTEATHMALRLARARTGKHKIVRFKGHFHGWHDHMTSGYTSHFDGAPTAGVLPDLAAQVILLPPGDREATRAAFEADDDIAAAILEPTGGSFGLVPHTPEFLGFLRELTAKHGVVLIFDEVITGFRVSPGGAQAYFGVTPDMSTHAKIVAGGLPGGAVAGRKELLDDLDFYATRESGREKIFHPGTFNANPVSAAAGTAALTIVRDSDACERASAFGDGASGRAQRCAGGGRRAVVGLWHLLLLPPLHEPAGARDRAIRLRSAHHRLCGAQGSPARTREQDTPRPAGERRGHPGLARWHDVRRQHGGRHQRYRRCLPRDHPHVASRGGALTPAPCGSGQRGCSGAPRRESTNGHARTLR